MIKVTWLASDRLGCGTYRCYLPALGLQDARMADSSFLFHQQITDVDRFFRDLEEGTQIVVFQRAVGTLFVDLMKQCRARGIATVFELDDNIFDVPRHNPAAWFWRRKAIQRTLRQQIELADRVIVSTAPLRAMVMDALGWGETDKIRVCMNHLHPAVWGRQVWGSVVPYHNQQTVIGWQGSTTHDQDFKQALPAMRLLADEFPQVMYRFFGCVPLSVKGIIPESRFQWTKGVQFERYPTAIRYANFDIGIAPVTDSTFNRSKSNIKWLEYSALGTPCVASRVYPYARSIDHGRTGFLATTTEEWYTHLKALVIDRELRATIGLAAEQEVWRAWGYETHGPKWAGVFNELATPALTLDQLITGVPDVPDPELRQSP